ncbi:molecular chaperone DnaJ [soil metagenome]
METKDLYKTLGITKGASQEDIRRSYRKLARENHPDANQDNPKAEERFKDIQHAYEILSDPSKRREYDEGPRAFFNRGNQAGGSSAGTTTTTFSDFSDLFGSFGNLGDALGQTNRGRNASAKGKDITMNVNLNFNDALSGITTKVNVPVEESCDSCKGTGAAPGTAPKVCKSCGGRGLRSSDQGFFALSEPCRECGGAGTVIEQPCATCRGVGRIKRSRAVTVKIPAGAKDGMKIRVPGKGNAGERGGPSGDLYVVTRIEKHPIFERQGNDFLIEVPVSFVEAALGARIDVPKPAGGTVRLRLPEGTQDGRRLKVPGAGAPRPRGGTPGDLIVKAVVIVPKKLRKREREILEAFGEEHDEDVRAELLRKAHVR